MGTQGRQGFTTNVSLLSLLISLAVTSKAFVVPYASQQQHRSKKNEASSSPHTTLRVPSAIAMLSTASSLNDTVSVYSPNHIADKRTLQKVHTNNTIGGSLPHNQYYAVEEVTVAPQQASGISDFRLSERELIARKLGLKVDEDDNYNVREIIEQLIVQTASVEKLQNVVMKKDRVIEALQVQNKHSEQLKQMEILKRQLDEKTKSLDNAQMHIENLESKQFELASKISFLDEATKRLEKRREEEYKDLQRSESNLQEALTMILQLEQILETSKRLDHERRKETEQAQQELAKALDRVAQLEQLLSEERKKMVNNDTVAKKSGPSSAGTEDDGGDYTEPDIPWFSSPLSAISSLETTKTSSAWKKTAPSIVTQEIPEIKDWKLTNSGELKGQVYNHPNIEAGLVIVTSPLAEPSLACEDAVVATESGSHYRLGARVKTATLPNTEAHIPNQRVPISEASTSGQMKQTESGETVDNGKYLLVGKGTKSSNGRCTIWTGYRSSEGSADGIKQPVGEALVMKVSNNLDAIKHEYANYQKYNYGVRSGAIVQCYDMLPVTDKYSRPTDKYALVLEKGREDLKDFRLRRAFDVPTLKDALRSAVRCLKSIHAAKMVWTDLKSENFVVIEDSTSHRLSFKAIDLESAVAVKGQPTDYTPEASPPEFANAFYSGDAYDFILEYSYDIWSFGMLAYEMSTRDGFYDHVKPEQIMKRLDKYDVPTRANIHEKVEDPKLADLITQCLSIDPQQRPSVQKIVKHPYFRTVGSPTPSIFGW